MNEVRFTCPFCSQNIACEAGHEGTRIQCPACQAGIIIPAQHAAGIAQAKAVSPPMRLDSARANSQGWTEDSWNEHVAALSGRKPPKDVSVLLAILQAIAYTIFTLAGAFALALGVLFAGCALLMRR